MGLFCFAVFNYILLLLSVIITFTNFNRLLLNITLLLRFQALEPDTYIYIIYIYNYISLSITLHFTHIIVEWLFKNSK